MTLDNIYLFINLITNVVIEACLVKKQLNLPHLMRKRAWKTFKPGSKKREYPQL